jgi:uncharacterized protein
MMSNAMSKVARVVGSLMLGFGVALALPASSRGQTPPSAVEAAAYSGLFKAVFDGDRGTVAKLLQTAPDLETLDSHGRTVLHVAAHRGDIEILTALLAAGAKHAAKDSRNYDAVTIVSVTDNEKALQVLLARGASAKLITSPYQGTALIAAAHLGHDGIVRQLIAAGAPLDHVNNLGWTAAIEAVILGNGELRHQRSLEALIKAGANTKIPDREGRTPLDHARSRGFSAMVDMLTKGR